VEPETRVQQMPASKPETPAPVAASPASTARRKLSYKEQRELDALPARIEELEQKQAALEARTADPAFYQQSRESVDAVLAELSELQAALDTAIERWAELEA